MGSRCSPLNQNTNYSKQFYVDAMKRKSSSLDPGTPVRKSKSNSPNKNTIKMIDNSMVNDYQLDSNTDVTGRTIINPHIRKHSTSNNDTKNIISEHTNSNIKEKYNDFNNNSNNTFNNNNSNNTFTNNNSNSINNNINNKPNSNSNNLNVNNSINNNSNSNNLNLNNTNLINNSNSNNLNNLSNNSFSNNSKTPIENKSNSNKINNNPLNNKFNEINNNSLNNNFDNSNSNMNINSNNLNNLDENNSTKVKDLKLRTNKKKVQFKVKDPPETHDPDIDNMDISINEKPEKHTILSRKTNTEPYNLANDLANLKCNITFAQLLDHCSKIRSDLIKDLKLEKLKVSTTMNFDKDFIYNYEATGTINNVFNEDDLSIVLASVDNVENKLLIDSGSNLNLISSNYFNSLPGEYETVGICHGRVCEALGDSSITDSIIVRLNVTINNYSFSANFCIVNHEANYFDLLIGLKTIADNYFFIHPISKSLARFNSNSSFEIIAPLLENQEMEYVTCFVKYIYNDKIINSLNYYENNINKHSYNNNFDINNFNSISPNNDNINNFYNNLNNVSNNPDTNKIPKINTPQNDNKIFSNIVTQPTVSHEENISPFDYIHSDKFKGEIDPQFRAMIINLLIEYIDVVATSSEQLTPSDLKPHHIELIKGAVPFKSKFYKLNKVKTVSLKELLKNLINQRLIAPSYSSWSSPIVLVLKKNGKYRLCSDYRRLNSITVPDSYALPNIDEIFSCLGGAFIFTTLDLFSGYHQIRMADDSIVLTSFTTKFGNFVYKVMPFGLTGAPATFQREMNRILFDLLGKCVFVFLDDILIFSNSFEDHLIHLKQVFDIFRKK